jgi:hypothetical protein
MALEILKWNFFLSIATKLKGTSQLYLIIVYIDKEQLFLIFSLNINRYDVV